MNLKNQIELELYFADHFDTILFPVLAELYLKQNDLKRARKVCDIGLKHHQNDSAGLFILAQIERLEGNLKEAETALEQVLLFSDDHLAAAEMLCEIQTVLGRASNRLLKSWKHVLELDLENETAQAFIKKVELGDDKKSKKKIMKPKKETKSQTIPKKTDLPPEPKVVPRSLLDQQTEPLEVSSRLATFTLVAVLKNQGLFDQALEVLDALEEKGESPESISLEREIIETLIAKFQKD
tara:strand:+ start:1907 stop:2623 length:717 start_codon:yes stop_codon:yes gene_type:complete